MVLRERENFYLKAYFIFVFKISNTVCVKWVNVHKFKQTIKRDMHVQC